MKKILIYLVVLASLIGNYAYAETYTYTGQNYSHAYGVFTTNMRATATLVTSSPIPPNSSYLDITPILTSWSARNGVQTISSTNGEYHPLVPPLVTTDAQGDIVAAYLHMFTSPLGTAIGDINDFIWILDFGDLVEKNASCVSVNSGYCDAWTPLTGDQASTNSAGLWVTGEPLVTEKPIPTLSQWSLILLASLFTLAGLIRVKRRTL